jgi:hypothetical protein
MGGWWIWAHGTCRPSRAFGRDWERRGPPLGKDNNLEYDGSRSVGFGSGAVTLLNNKQRNDVVGEELWCGWAAWSTGIPDGLDKQPPGENAGHCSAAEHAERLALFVNRTTSEAVRLDHASSGESTRFQNLTVSIMPDRMRCKEPRCPALAQGWLQVSYQVGSRKSMPGRLAWLTETDLGTARVWYTGQQCGEILASVSDRDHWVRHFYT